MTTESIPPAGEATMELEIPNDMYVGLNVVRRHIAEFFYRAGTQALLASGETVLAIFDCILLEPNGRRLGGLTLHDYAVLTDQNLITWGRGLNRDVIDKFEWSSVGLDKFGRRTPIEGVIKVTYNYKSVGNKRRISIKSSAADDIHDAPAIPATLSGVPSVLLYLDLMPIGDVRICAGMMQYMIRANNSEGVSNTFKETFRADITRSQQRMATVNDLMRTFYMDLGNGMLVEADTVRDLQSVRSSPYRGPSSPYQNTDAPYRNTGVKVNRGDASAAALNRSGKSTNTMSGAERDESGTAGNTLKETVKLNNGPINRPSKLEEYERRVSGRPPTGGGGAPSAAPSRLGGASGESRLIPPGGESATPPRVAAAPARPARAERPAPAPRPARAERPAPGLRVRATPPPRAFISAAQPVERRTIRAGEVLDEGGTAYETTRPVTMPIVVALGRELLNPYSLSRLARGLWIDPRNLVRNASDISQTAGAVADIANVVASDEEARTVAVNRVRESAYSVFRDNIILHYTVWPFIKPILDIVLLPASGDVAMERHNRVRVRGAEMLDPESADTDLPDLGAMTGTDVAAIKPAAAKVAVIVEETPKAPVVQVPMSEDLPEVPAVRAPVDLPEKPRPPRPTPPSSGSSGPTASLTPASDKPLNVSGKGSTDPTTGSTGQANIPDVSLPSSKLGDDFGPGNNGPKKIGFKK